MQPAWPKRFWWAAFSQAVVVFGALGTWFFFTTRTYLANPPDGDVYAHTWSYQALAFFITYGAWAVLLLVVLIALELTVWSWFTSRRGNLTTKNGEVETGIGNRAP
jgi:hypothetical protein